MSSENKIRNWNNCINYLLRVWKQEAISNSEGATFEKNLMKRLRAKSRATEPTIWIGKEGPSQELVQQVTNQLRARELVKLKLQKSVLTKSKTVDIAEEIARSTDSSLVDVMGHTFTLYKKHENTQTKRDSNSRLKISVLN